MPKVEFCVRTNKVGSKCTVTVEYDEEDIPEEEMRRGDFLHEEALWVLADEYEISWEILD